MQYIAVFQNHEQTAIIGVRLLQLCVLLALIKHFSVATSLGLTKPSSQAVRIFLLISTVCTSCVAILYLLQPHWFAYINTPPWLHGFSGLLLMVLLAPMVEELFFRGLLYRVLREQWGIVVSVAVSAVFFSLVHHGFIFSPQLLGGIIFAFAYEWSRSLWVAMALHMGANSAVYMLSVLML